MNCLLLSLLLGGQRLIAQENNPLIASGPVIKEGIQLHDEGKYKEAILKYKLVPRSDTNYVWALYEMGLSYTADSQLQKALDTYRYALSLKKDPEREPDLYTNYASVVDDLGEKDKALLIYDSAIRKYPAHSGLKLNKATTLLTMERDAEAEELLKQNLLIDPFSYSSHFLLGLSAVRQGKVVPAFISFFGYLMMSPSGKYHRNAINLLSLIAENKEDLKPYIEGRKEEPSESYQLLEQIILSKIALNKNYKPLIKLDDAISRQIQVTLEKIEYSEEDKDFWNQYYTPLFKDLFNKGKFEPLIYHMFSNVDIPNIQEYVKKNKKEIQSVIDIIVPYLNEIKTTRTLVYTQRAGVKNRWLFDGNELTGKGLMDDKGEMSIGKWEFYYDPGNIRSLGEYDDKGLRKGDWRYFYFNQQPRAEETYVSGKMEGKARYFFENGVVSSEAVVKEDEPVGIKKSNYYSGKPRTLENYVNGKLEGEKRIYFVNGFIHFIERYKADSLHGKYESYYQNGQLEYVTQYNNGKLEGLIKGYHENGKTDFEGNYKDGKKDGAWKRYHPNGTLKSNENYVADKLEGPYEEFHDNGKLFYKANYKKGSANEEISYYDTDGILFSTLLFQNDHITKAAYYDKKGKLISQSALKNKKLAMEAYRPDGTLKSRVNYNDKGESEGTDTLYYASGKVQEINHYSEGVLEGLSVSFHPNGQKSREIPYVKGAKDGYFKSYYQNGVVEQEGWYKEDQAQGTWIDRDELGNITEKTDYRDDDLHGYKLEYWPNGKMASERENEYGWIKSVTQFDTTGKVINQFVMDKFTGPYTLVYASGKKGQEGYYHTGNMQGAFKGYYFDGSLERESYYKSGLLDSVYKSFYFGGKPSSTGQYKNGKKTGLWTYYRENGTKYSTETYEDDEVQGKRFYFHENGKTETIVEVKDGQKHGWTEKFSEDGQLVYKVQFVEGLPVAYTYQGKDGKLVPEIPLKANSGKIETFYANGNRSALFQYADGKLQGLNQLFHPNGKLQFESTENYNESEGKVREFYADGSIKTEYNAKSDNVNGKYTYYHPGGIKKEEGFQVNDEVHGEVTHYDEKGKLTQTRIYYYGTLIGLKK